ncbi:MAG: MOSC domain-containing protein, partial [Herpetosiphonaceae bacterium]|nr:MOSC domain-containing protein [Herpetosiphonaceae bacterium]
MHISDIYYYPIKSCRGSRVDSAQLEPRGLQHDRRLMITSAAGVFLTQREHPRLALIEPAIRSKSLPRNEHAESRLIAACDQNTNDAMQYNPTT